MKANNNIEDYTKMLVQTSGLNTPSSELMKNIMINVSHKPVQYQPLITKNVWLVIFFIMTIFLSGIYIFLYQPGVSLISLSSLYDFNLAIHLPVVSISNTLLYCFVFLLLFLIQVPFIKHFIERNYQY